MALDPVQMLRAAGIEPDPWQARLSRSRAQRILLNCHRQSGKSTIAAAIADHTAFYEPGSLVLLLSQSLRQSQELFRKCLDVYQALDRPFAPEAESALRLELENGSRIVSLPGREGTIRGYSGVRLLIIDEDSRVPDEVYMAARPMLAVSGGRLIQLSTPFGTRGHFWETWKRIMAERTRDTFIDEALKREAEQTWDYYEVPATECPRISAEFLEEERETMGDWWFQQEYMCKFLDAQTAAFRSEDIEKIVKPGVEQWLLT